MGFNTTWASLGAAQWLGRANSFTYFLPSHSRHSHREVVKALEWIYGCLDIQIILWNFSIFTFPRRTFAGKKGIFLVNIEATLNVKCEKKPLKISRQSGQWEQCEMLGVWRRTETSLTGIFSQNTGGGPTDGVLWDCSQHHHLTSLVTTHLSALSSSVQWEGSSWLLSTVNSHIFLPVSDISLHHFLSSPRSWSTRIRLSSINLNKILTTI